METNSELSTNMIKEYPKSSDSCNDEIKIIGKLSNKIGLTKNKHIIVGTLALSGLIFVSGIIGLSFEVSYWTTVNLLSADPQNTTFEKTVSPLLPKPTTKSTLDKQYGRTEISTKHYNNGTGSDILSSLRFETIKTTTDTIPRLITSTKSDIGIQTSTKDDFRANEDEDGETSTCEEFRLTSSGIILRYMPELIGVYRLENGASDGNNTLMYTNEANGIVLAQSDKFSLNQRIFPWLQEDLRNLWLIQDSSFKRTLAVNGFCNDANFPNNGACQHGWIFVHNTTTFQTDWTASVTCNVPHQTAEVLPSESICKDFELKPTKNIVESVFHRFIGHYELTDSIHNHMAVYKGVNLSTSLFYDIDNNGNGAWKFGNETLPGVVDYGRIERNYDVHEIHNVFCSHVQGIMLPTIYPAIGECTNDWLGFTLYVGEWDWKLHPEIRATLQCTKY